MRIRTQVTSAPSHASSSPLLCGPPLQPKDVLMPSLNRGQSEGVPWVVTAWQPPICLSWVSSLVDQDQHVWRAHSKELSVVNVQL